MAFNGENEQALVRQAQGGNPQAMAALLQQNYAAVYRTMIKLTLDARAAEDATQDAMERAVRSFGSFDPEKSKLSTWLISIARNRWIDEIRKNRRLAPAPSDPGCEAEAPGNPYDAVIEGDALLRALKRMDRKARTPLTMCYLLGYSYREIADEMRIPLGTVKSRISNGIKLLRREIGPDE